MSIPYTCRACGDVFDSETVRDWGLCACPACRDVPDKLASDLKCCRCGDKLTGMFYGAGDGTGQKFACPHCYWRGEAESLRAQLAAARVEGERETRRASAAVQAMNNAERATRTACMERDRYAEALREIAECYDVGKSVPSMLAIVSYARAALKEGER